MTAWFYNGLVPAGILAILVGEFVVLALARPAALRALWPSLCAGAGLVLGWVAADCHAPWFVVALVLALAGVAHFMELRRSQLFLNKKG